MSPLKTLKDSLLHLAFPHVCAGCGSDLLEPDHRICLACRATLPETGFHLHPDNPVARIFWGRLPLLAATSQYYFTKGARMQQLLHALKYNSDREVGLYLGGLMGTALATVEHFSAVDLLVPLPLFAARERKRGYNQATLLCTGMATIWKKPVAARLLARVDATETQTKKNRMERWQNMQGKFALLKNDVARDKHVLLVDDVLTTGATMEACGQELLKVPGLRLSLATLCFSSGN